MAAEAGGELDKQNGETKGFTPQEIEQRTPEMQRLQRRGENLYYTPLSDSKHHILIDDMDRGKLEKLIQNKLIEFEIEYVTNNVRY